jgi:mono/diheme cytochrome c family protein
MQNKNRILLALALMLVPVIATAQNKTVWSGIYTEAQATSGQAVYNQYCAGCHSQNLIGGASQGAPALKGDKFMEAWREDSLESLFTKIRTTMPRRDPKSLSEKETVDIVAYIMQANEFPVGSELSASSLSSIRIQRQDGPKPLPNYAIVSVVGCMTPDGDNWTLTKAADPSRLRVAEKATADELKAAGAKPLGTQTFRLQNLAMLGAFDPQAHKGHKMMAKGPVIRNSSGERISVTELEMVGSSCEP